MNIVREIGYYPRTVDGVAVSVIQNLWSDGGVSYSLADAETGEYLSDEDFDHMPTDPEVRPFLNKDEKNV